jgi:predicted enzyme related to lactoylglutathione lyase
MSRPVHFEIPADQPERAIAFYEKVFGWKIAKWDGPMPYWMVSTGDKTQPGIDGGILPRQHPGQGVVNTVGVADVDASVASVESAGGKIIMPKMAIPGVGWLAYFTDPEGNACGLMQSDPSAK